MSTLDGNWLLSGALPTTIGNSIPSPAGFAVSFDVQESKIVASAVLEMNCLTGPLEVIYGEVLIGTVSADGSFSIASVTSGGSLPSLKVAGALPKSPGTAWSGTYSYSDPSGGCAPIPSTPFTATYVKNITGTYSGSATLIGPSGAPLPVSVTLALTQGTNLTSSTGVPTYDSLGLSGTLQVQGISCFSTGTIASKSYGAVEGDLLSAAFTMNDGSSVFLTGYDLDTSSTQLGIESLLVPEGPCEGVYLPGATLTLRQ